MRLAGLLAALWPPLCPAPPSHAALQASSESAEARQGLQLVVACNGFSDVRDTFVGVRTRGAEADEGTREVSLLELALHPREAREQYRLKRLRSVEQHHQFVGEVADYKRRATSTTTSAPQPWSLAKDLKGMTLHQHVSYGECTELRVDLRREDVFFVLPGGNASCVLDAADAVNGSDVEEGGLPARVAAVAMQPEDGVASCEVRSAAFPRRLVAREGYRPSEVAILDAYTQAKAPPEDPVELELDEEDRRKGLPPMPRAGEAAAVRLEDVLGQEHISTEVVGSVQLAIGNAYRVDARPFHLILEDLRGEQMWDRKDVNFRLGRSYVALRLGRGNSTDFPEKVVVYECQGCGGEPEPPAQEPTLEERNPEVDALTS